MYLWEWCSQRGNEKNGINRENEQREQKMIKVDFIVFYDNGKLIDRVCSDELEKITSIKKLVKWAEREFPYNYIVEPIIRYSKRVSINYRKGHYCLISYNRIKNDVIINNLFKQNNSCELLNNI